MMAASKARRVHIMAMLRLWLRREYGSSGRRGGGGEDVPELSVLGISLVDGSGKGSGLELGTGIGANSVAGGRGEAVVGSDGGGGFVRVYNISYADTEVMDCE